MRFDAEAVGLYYKGVLLRIDRANPACRISMIPIFGDVVLRAEMAMQSVRMSRAKRRT